MPNLGTLIKNLLIEEGHDEPVGQLDRWDGVGDEAKGSDR